MTLLLEIIVAIQAITIAAFAAIFAITAHAGHQRG